MLYGGRVCGSSATGVNTLDLNNMDNEGQTSTKKVRIEGMGLARLLNGACRREHANCKGRAVTVLYGNGFADTTIVAITTSKAISANTACVWEYGSGMFEHLKGIGCTCSLATCQWPRSGMSGKRSRDVFAQTAEKSVEDSRLAIAAAAPPHVEDFTIVPLLPEPAQPTPTQSSPTLVQMPAIPRAGRPTRKRGLNNKHGPQLPGEDSGAYRRRCKRLEYAAKNPRDPRSMQQRFDAVHSISLGLS